MDALLRDDPRQRPPGRVRHRRGGDPAVRGGPGRRWPASSAPPSERGGVHQERHRGHQPGRLLLGPGQPGTPATSSCSPRWSTTPTWCPWLMLKAERGIELRYLPLDRRRPARPRPTSTGLLDGAKLLGVTAMSNVLGTINPIRRAGRRRPRRRRPGPGRRGPARPAPADRRQGPRRRLLRLHRPQDARARPGSAPCGPGAELLEAMPPFLGGGEMIRDVRLDGFTPTTCPGSSRPARRRSPRRSASTAAVDYLSALGMPAVRDARAGPHRVRPRRPDATATRDLIIHGPARRRPSGAGSSPSPTRTSTRTTCPRCSTKPGCACGPATTAPSRSCAGLGVGATARASFSVYNDEADVDALVDALATADRLFS